MDAVNALLQAPLPRHGGGPEARGRGLAMFHRSPLRVSNVIGVFCSAFPRMDFVHLASCSVATERAFYGLKEFDNLWQVLEGWLPDEVKWNWEHTLPYGDKAKGRLQVLMPGDLRELWLHEFASELATAITALAARLESHGDLRAAQELGKGQKLFAHAVQARLTVR